jgi:DNA-binding response OmpR family regulator
MRILIVEDEQKIAQFTSNILKEMAYATDIAPTGSEARDLFELIEYDLVILDLMLPDINGISLCKTFKEMRPNRPVLMLTTLSEIHDKVRGLDSGADDYMTKPFHTEEFTARVRALLRRNQDSTLTLECADLQLDLVKRQALRNGETIKLTTKEYALLEYLMRNQGRPLSRVQISQHVWDLHFDPESNIVDAYIKQLRKKIDHNGPKKLIKTIIGHGYTINED